MSWWTNHDRRTCRFGFSSWFSNGTSEPCVSQKKLQQELWNLKLKPQNQYIWNCKIWSNKTVSSINILFFCWFNLFNSTYAEDFWRNFAFSGFYGMFLFSIATFPPTAPCPLDPPVKLLSGFKTLRRLIGRKPRCWLAMQRWFWWNTTIQNTRWGFCGWITNSLQMCESFMTELVKNFTWFSL